MSETNQPTPYELCRIAASLLDNELYGKSFKDAVEGAMELWNAAVQRLSEKDGSSHKQDASGIPIDRDWEARIANRFLDPLLLASQDRSESKAMEWISNNTKDDRDRFKTVEKFKSAWMKIFPDTQEFYGAPVAREKLEEFLTIRSKNRRASDRERKRKGRENKKPKRRS